MKIGSNRIEFTYDNLKLYADLDIHRSYSKRRYHPKTVLHIENLENCIDLGLEPNNRYWNSKTKEVYKLIVDKFDEVIEKNEFVIKDTMCPNFFKVNDIRFHKQTGCWRFINKKSDNTFEHMLSSNGYNARDIEITITIHTHEGIIKKDTYLVEFERNKILNQIEQNKKNVKSYQDSIAKIEEDIIKCNDRLQELLLDNPQFMEVFL